MAKGLNCHFYPNISRERPCRAVRAVGRPDSRRRVRRRTPTSSPRPSSISGSRRLRPRASAAFRWSTGRAARPRSSARLGCDTAFSTVEECAAIVSGLLGDTGGSTLLSQHLLESSADLFRQRRSGAVWTKRWPRSACWRTKSPDAELQGSGAPLYRARRPGHPHRHDETVEDVRLRHDALQQGEPPHHLPQDERAAEDHVLASRRQAESTAPLRRRLRAQDVAPPRHRRHGSTAWWIRSLSYSASPSSRPASVGHGAGQPDEPPGPTGVHQSRRWRPRPGPALSRWPRRPPPSRLPWVDHRAGSAP